MNNPSPAEADTSAQPDPLADLASEVGAVLSGGQPVPNEGASPVMDGAAPAAPLITAEMALPWCFGALKGLGNAVTAKTGVAYRDETLKEGAALMAPLVVKYQVMPAWLVPYEAEFKFGMWAAGVAWQTYSVIAEAKAAEALAAKARADGKQPAA